jgi:NAD(P)-dependent dehydrogenase (short-subunit alcohol dehydrogenase family)
MKSDPLFSVAGQVVLVSGASRGIGWGIAKGFADRGATVVITGRERETLEPAAKALGGNSHAVVCDVAREKDIERAVDAVTRRFGRIDTLINVAGVNRRMKAETYSVPDYDFIVDINLKGPWLLSLAVGKGQLQRGKGCQINVTSLNNDRPLRGVAPYAISKAGLQMMTRALAAEWGPRGVRVNALAPGFILTDLTTKLWSQPKMKRWAKENTPLGRLGTPEDLAGAALFLASPGASFVTGHTLFADGGCSAGWAWPIDLG